MKKTFLFFSFISVVLSCKVQSSSDKLYSDIEKQKYQLRLNPTPNSKYYFEVNNETRVEMEVEGKDIENINRSNVGMTYDVNNDSSGNFIFNILYDKIHLYTKNNDQESNMDAENAAVTINPVEKMLGSLKTANIKVTVSPLGEMKSISGYQELGAKMMEGIALNDMYARQMAQSQWNQLVENGLVKNNLEQLFKLFPDSAIRIGDKWKLNSKQEDEFGLNVKTTYKLKDISSNMAVIESESKMENDQAVGSSIGLNSSANLKGEQKGRYEIDTKTGMLISSKIGSKLKGTILTMGKEVPIVIETTLNITGRKVN